MGPGEIRNLLSELKYFFFFFYIKLELNVKLVEIFTNSTFL